MTDNESKQLLEMHKYELDKTAFDSMVPILKTINEVYFIAKMRPDTIIEWIEEKHKNKLPNRLLVAINTYIEDSKFGNFKDLVLRMDFIKYPFYFESVIYGKDKKKQKTFAETLLTQDSFILFLVVEYNNGKREILFSKKFSFSNDATKNGIKKILELI